MANAIKMPPILKKALTERIKETKDFFGTLKEASLQNTEVERNAMQSWMVEGEHKKSMIAAMVATVSQDPEKFFPEMRKRFIDLRLAVDDIASEDKSNVRRVNRADTPEHFTKERYELVEDGPAKDFYKDLEKDQKEADEALNNLRGHSYFKYYRTRAKIKEIIKQLKRDGHLPRNVNADKVATEIMKVALKSNGENLQSNIAKWADKHYPRSSSQIVNSIMPTLTPYVKGKPKLSDPEKARMELNETFKTLMEKFGKNLVDKCSELARAIKPEQPAPEIRPSGEGIRAGL